MTLTTTMGALVPATVIAAAVVLAAGAAEDRPAGDSPAAGERIVCLGDSITDGYTYGQIIMQALKEAGRPVPTVICAGVASDTAPQMLARLERDVLPYEPALVTFSAGTNDSLRGISPEQYEAAVREVCRKCKDRKMRMIILTPCIIDPGSNVKGAAEAPGATTKAVQAYRQATARAAAAEELGQKYDAILRKLAGEFGWPVAECNKLQRKARADGNEIMSPDGIHPNYLGQALMARSILDAMGCQAVGLPKEFRPTLFPGVVRQWRIRAAPVDEKKKPETLTEESVKGLRCDDSWKTLTVPCAIDKPVSAADWLEQVRRNGFAVNLDKTVGKGPYQAVAEIDSPKERQVWISLGIGVTSVFLNGKQVWTHPRDSHGSELWMGFHAGKARLEAPLRQGTNTLAIETNGPQFFVSVNDAKVWEDQYAKTIGEPEGK